MNTSIDFIKQELQKNPCYVSDNLDFVLHILYEDMKHIVRKSLNQANFDYDKEIKHLFAVYDFDETSNSCLRYSMEHLSGILKNFYLKNKIVPNAMSHITDYFHYYYDGTAV